MKTFEHRMELQWDMVLELGEDGWELVAVTIDSRFVERYFLKREVPDKRG